MALVRYLRTSLALSTVFLVALGGCKEDEEIRKETVEHPDREMIRLRVAVMEQKEVVWFIRMSGPVDVVKTHEKAFEDFVRSVRFKDDEPTWTDPAGWKKDPRSKGRYAGFRIDAKPKELEIAVTQLPAEGFDLMKNMHRWQKQVNLPLTEEHKALDEQVKREKVADQDVRWVDLTGRGVHTVSKPPEPMAANAKKFMPELPMQKPVGAGKAGGGGKLPFTFTVPAGWVKKPDRQLILAAFEVSDGKLSAETTLSQFGGSVGGNISRWRGQVKLPELSDADAEKSAKELTVAGIRGYYVDLANPAGGTRILGVVVPMGQQNWFIKMTGPSDFVGKHKADFETFAKSFKMEK